MPDARLYIEENVEPGLALERGAALYGSLDSANPVAMYGATLRGDAWVLGAHQLASQVLPRPTVGVPSPLLTRRASGGVTLRAGDGIVYVALGLRERAALMPCPKARILNRNVRGALQGLRLSGIIAHYFGRDFLSVDARPAVYVGWGARTDGRVLLEFFLSDRTNCFLSPDELGYPGRKDDPFRGKQPWTLREAQAAAGAREPAGGRQLIEQIAEGYRKGFAVGFQSGPLPAEWQQQLTAEALDVSGRAELAGRDVGSRRAFRPSDADSAALYWSHPIEEAIGFISAGVALDSAAKLARVVMCGDFFADDGCGITLERMLIGVEPSTDHIGRAVDAAYGSTGPDVEGVRDLRSFQTAILDAVARARGGA
jgi:hypothetical protein